MFQRSAKLGIYKVKLNVFELNNILSGASLESI